DQIKDTLRNLPSKPPMVRLRSLFYTLAHGDDTEYDQFENRDGEISSFRENDAAFRLFGSGVHVKIGAYITAVVGFSLTLLFCVFYSLYHSRGQGRNFFLDSIELIDLIFAFLIGIPCHIILGIGIYQERKTFFGPFLVFYATNFILNVVFTALTLIAAAFDFHRQFFGNIQWDFSWTFFQIVWTSAQALAIYVVFKCRRYIAARCHFKSNTSHFSTPFSITTDAITSN
ncbi:hypothetical protein PFISCL1PPCAC_19685, partial [Pristionchus fissidentatus]